MLAIRSPAPSSRSGIQYRGASYAAEPQRLITNPGGDVRLAAGQLLVVLGSQAQLRQVAAVLGSALQSVGRMAT